MFKLNPRAFLEAVASDEEPEEDDDCISLTSTVDNNDPNQEYAVENILAEGLIDGTMHYLIQWTGFPLHECTWEPESNLGSELKAIWEGDKAKHESGELDRFDVQKFYDARDEAVRAKSERHRRRNKKRQKLGKPLTEPFPDDEAASRNSSDWEAAEEDSVAAAEEGPSQKIRVSHQQQKSKQAPSSRPSLAPIAAAVPASSRPPNQANRQPSATGRQEVQTNTSSSAKERQTAAQPRTTDLTGYQGTAKRRPSKLATGALSESKPRPTTSFPSSTSTAGPSPKSSSGARKPLTAKKSMAQPTGNIFTGGKVRKPRASLIEAMSDPTKAPQHLNKHRFLRKAELASRGKEDLPPMDPSQLDLIEARTMQPIRKQSSGASFVLSPTQLSPQQAVPPTPEYRPAQSSVTLRPRPALRDSDAAHPAKKQKTVRFESQKSVRIVDEDDSLFVQEPEQMDLDSPVTRGHSRSLRSPPPAQPSPSLAQNQWTQYFQAFQSLDKKLMVNQSSVEVTFNGLPQEGSHQQAWLADFAARESLQFTHSCFAKTAALKIGGLIKESLASGTIVSKEAGPALDRLAEHLTTGMLGLYYTEADYNVLVYPTHSEEWNLPTPSQSFTTPSEAPLRFLIFSSPEDSNPAVLLPHVDALSQFGLGDANSISAHKDQKPLRELMMKRFFEIDYNKLLPGVTKTTTHNFFLAIPNSRGDIGHALFDWLRACNPTCQIFTSHQAGGWGAFRARVEPPDGVPGVVIIHETLAWSMRRFPKLSKYLLGRNDEYWCISEPVHGLPLYPSISVPESPALPGDVRFTRLFPYRTAILLTPSFLVSEPRRSLRFFEWFRRWEGNFMYRLVTACNIHEYLKELANERYQARQDLLSHPGELQIEIQENLSALSREDCRCRYVVAEFAADLHLAREAQAGFFAHDEDNSQLVYADSSIDPNDEQSLVNWFGWWATLRADQFRKFHIIGSSHTIKQHGSRRGERIVRIPKYSKVTLNDPDAVLEVLQERNDQLEEQETQAGGGETNMQLAADANKRISFSQGPWAFRSSVIRREDSECFAEYLGALTALDGFKWQWMIYKFPVSWLDLSMGEYFGDFTARFPRIHDWFAYTFPFGACYKEDRSRPSDGRPPPGPPRGYNTYLGFFYTIEKEWDPPPPAKPVERHPWIAVYRPVNPHMKPHRRCEVIIWDPAARSRYPNGQAPAEKDLIFMQRQLIQCVREQGDEKNNGTWLDQVWFGGWDWPPQCDSQYPVDVTLLFLREMLSDVKYYLPAPERVMESKGYRRVRLGSSSPSPTMAPAILATTTTNTAAAAASAQPDSPLFVKQDRMDIDDPPPHHHIAQRLPSPSSSASMSMSEGGEDDDDDKDARIIFHPPRGHHNNNKRPVGVPNPFRSRCFNRLYEEARLARARSAAGGTAPTHMGYRFVPTMDWYREQWDEGREFAHVNVDSWEGVFGLLRIGEDKGFASGSGSGSSSVRATAAALVAEGHGHGGTGGGSGSGSGMGDRYGRGSVGSG
ncbi:hypothetical protein N658DRAFT_59617 [Parathielavia hyrcaniae]|uniref:Chromo domain-containing protein n=1 Tax=Parathielavia hyrcaniae TaxID=113614 RepID=A0AAN6Q0S3_9PEZI|nr:hypothetical protein N658DRAFT_59617 [Parathielavia hyrcaniae]